MDTSKKSPQAKGWENSHKLSPPGGPGTTPIEGSMAKYGHLLGTFTVFAERNARRDGYLMEYLAARVAAQRLLDKVTLLNEAQPVAEQQPMARRKMFKRGRE